MMPIAELIGTLSHYFEAQRGLAQCRAAAKGDVDYYSYSYIENMKSAEQALATTLNGYIDQRVAEELKRLATPSP
jgi:hypothetical protein